MPASGRNRIESTVNDRCQRISERSQLAPADLVPKVHDALATIEQALQVNPAELSWRPEVIRIRGELWFRLRQTEAAEADFRDAIALAQKTGAKAWEMRAAMSLARLFKARRDSDKAREVLTALYASFNEGFDTADLKDARALLGELDA
jgi:hypothetical protein